MLNMFDSDISYFDIIWGYSHFPLLCFKKVKSINFNSGSYFIYRWFSIVFHFPVWASSKKAGGLFTTPHDHLISVMEGPIPLTEGIRIVCFKMSNRKELSVAWWNTFKTFCFASKFFVFRYIFFQIKILHRFFLHSWQLCVILFNIEKN